MATPPRRAILLHKATLHNVTEKGDFAKDGVLAMVSNSAEEGNFARWATLP
jgi:hypothetical protein